MPDIRLIDANALCKGINESIKMALDWENEALEQKDTCGVKHAIATRQSLLAMLERVVEEPTIDAQPVKRGHWINHFDDLFPEESTIECSVCHENSSANMPHDNFCPNCGAKMGGDADGNEND